MNHADCTPSSARIRQITPLLPGLLLGLLLLTVPSATFGQVAGTDELEARVADIFERSCAQAGCHAAPLPQQEMDLSRDRFYAALVDEPSKERPELKRVHPGKPDSSYLVMKVRGDSDIVGAQMPLIGDKLSEEEVQAIEAWISQLSEVDQQRKQEAPPPEPLAFSGWKIVNLPTTRTLAAGNWLFLISHRLNPKISDGYEAFYGLDGSGIINLSLGYALADNLVVSLSRSNSADNVEAQLRWRLLRQNAASGWPVDVGVLAALNAVTEDLPDDAEPVKFTGQISIARDFNRRVGLAVVPGILINPSEREKGDGPVLTLGLGGRLRFYRNVSLVGEWVPIVSGFTRTTTFGNENRFDSWGGGLEIATGGHVFQIVVSNTVGLTSDQYLRGGDLDIRDGDLRLGFNIFRILNF